MLIEVLVLLGGVVLGSVIALELTGVRKSIDAQIDLQYQRMKDGSES